MLNNPTISIIITCRNEEKFISRCLDSILAQDYPKDKLEVLIVDGLSQDRTKDIADEYILRLTNIRIMDNRNIIASHGFNIGVKASTGENIAWISAHSVYPTDYFAKCVEYLEKTGADNVGGVCKHVGSGFVGQAIALAEGCKFGLGGARFRTATKDQYVDTIFPGFWPRKTFDKHGYMNEKLVRNQDIEFNSRIRKAGGKIFLTPKIISYYYCRSNLKDLWIQNFRNGFWNIETTKIAPGSLSFRHFIPLFFVTSLLATWMIPKLWVIIISYLFCSLFFSTKIALVNEVKYFFVMPIIFLTLHLSYGFGSLFGLFNLGMNRAIKLFRRSR